MFLTVSSPTAVSLKPCLAPRSLTMIPIQRNRKCLPLTGAQSKPSLFLCKNFDRKRLLRKYASCAGSVVLLSHRSCLFLLPPLLFRLQPPSTKGHIDPSRPRAWHAVAVSSHQAPCSLGLLGYCARCEKRLPCCDCTGSAGSHPELDCLFKAAQMRDYIHDHTGGRGAVHACAGLAC